MRLKLPFVSLILFLPIVSWSSICTFHTWDWDTINKRAVNHRQVSKPKAKLLPAERDRQSPCTVCEEDQVWIQVDGLPKVRVCRHFGGEVRQALEGIRNSGYAVHKLVGYRVGKTKGKINANGYRTQYSHHSFGTAIDVNSKANGLYDNCLVFGSQCRLIRGGAWSLANPSSIQKGSAVYESFREIGWRWGGELEGRQKDFMHFSLSGD